MYSASPQTLKEMFTLKSQSTNSMKTITITIDKQGKPTIEANGFSGGDCFKFTKPIEDALGAGTVIEEKPEMFLPAESEDGNQLTL